MLIVASIVSLNIGFLVGILWGVHINRIEHQRKLDRIMDDLYSQTETVPYLRRVK